MDLAQAQQLLIEQRLTCIIFGDEVVYTSTERGIRPLLRLIETGVRLNGLSAVDKVVGRAAAFAYVILGISRLHAGVISIPAREILRQHQITVTYDTLTEFIQNRAGNGRCPLESAVLDIEDSGEALTAIRRRLAELNKGGKKMGDRFFDGVKKNFGFGCMRLPMQEGRVDHEETCRMVDCFLENGFNYFDTAHGYLNGQSETALKECLVKRHDRDVYILVNKLTNDYFHKEEDIRPFFRSQLDACGVEYFDVYLMHAQNADIYKKFKSCRAYETAFALKAEGKVKHVGISFHDTADVLDQILTEYPELEAVQLQLNYLDYDDVGIQGRKCYEVCVKHDKPVIVMEPVKGGSLIRLPQKAQEILDELKGGSNASYAIRFAAGFDQVMMVLSGMSSMEQMQDNISYMKDFKPLSEKEQEAVQKVCRIFKEQDMIPCTACRYCVAGCPMKIAIPDLFADMNAKKTFQDWNSDMYYSVHTQNAGKASDCIKCGKCESACPQHLEIRKLLGDVAKQFE